MTATTRPAGALAVLAAGLALAGCGTTTTTAAPDATAPPPLCRTTALTWTLSLLDGDGDGDGDSGTHGTHGTGSSAPEGTRNGTAKGPGASRPNARLTAVNKASGACLFAGYPGLELHNGKAESIDGTGPGHPAALSLPGHTAVAVDLRYTPRDTAGGADAWCVRQGEAVVRAPRDSHGTAVPVTDAHGRTAVLDACGETIAMAPPRRTRAGT
ncbi:DUF4232 domain-containing protein [Streptomyces sp. NPDC051132]|uniref:DUF4232 domain-containing protein n=1 Tax=unclassified Streptomyces TaxID=2593676 RepID=UPI003431EDB3